MTDDERARRLSWACFWKRSDPAFMAELKALDRTDYWKRFAVAGKMMADLVAADGRPPATPPSQTAETRRAWLWGYEWKRGAKPPEDKPEGACAECWRLGEPCSVHYDGVRAGSRGRPSWRDPQLAITSEVIERLRERHMRMYQRRLESGSPAVVVNETSALLELWRGMAGKTWLTLSEPEEGEVVDALGDEGWEFQADDEGDVFLVREASGD